MTITKNGWKLSGSFAWAPIEGDVKENCHTCRGTGNDFFDEGDCSSCAGLGFRYIVHERGEKPEIPKHLVQWMRDAYLEWEELYGHA